MSSIANLPQTRIFPFHSDNFWIIGPSYIIVVITYHNNIRAFIYLFGRFDATLEPQIENINGGRAKGA
jgi:hypothetical protein